MSMKQFYVLPHLNDVFWTCIFITNCRQCSVEVFAALTIRFVIIVAYGIFVDRPLFIYATAP